MPVERAKYGGLTRDRGRHDRIIPRVGRNDSGRRLVRQQHDHTRRRQVANVPPGVLGISEADLRVYDFEVRMFPTLRQDILEEMIVLQQDLDPDCVLLPALIDLHQDHKTIAEEGLRAFKRTTVMAYEIPWNNLNFQQQAYVRLEERHIDKKVEALGCYESQGHRNYTREDYIRNVALTRGINIGCDFAEVFEVYRWIL